MTTRIGIGFSNKSKSTEATREAAEMAKASARQDRIDAAFIFNTSYYDPKNFLPLAFDALKQTKIIGTSTAGIILSDRIETQGIGIVTITSDEIKFESSVINHLALQNIEEAGDNFAKEAVTDYGQEQRKLFLLFINSLVPKIPLFLRGIKNQLGKNIEIIGGGSCDNFHIEKIYQYHDNQCISDGATGFLIGGYPKIKMSCKHGWMPLGKPRTVDKVEGNIIKSINGESPINAYIEYFEKDMPVLMEDRFNQIIVRYPLGMRTNDENNKYHLKHIINILPDGSIVCQDQIPENSEVNIMFGNKDSCILSAENAARAIKDQLGDKPLKLLLIFESLFRYKILNKAAYQEIRAIKNVLGKNFPIMGIYTYGEIFTQKIKNVSAVQIQNGSIVLIAFF